MQRGKITLIIGGGRSGKSSYGEALAKAIEGERFYIATAEVTDEEMAKRIEAHQKRREGLFSKTIEEPLDLAKALAKTEGASVVLLDCLTVWLGNVLHRRGLLDYYSEVEEFIEALKNNRTNLIIITNEVGQGIIPATQLSRHYRDHAGWLNQAVAQIADKVVWMVAGIPVVVKGGEV
ncbi:MAG: bifunctional adenosylcobinamide kinase/adenosylcobinamide-phosphate guanylyltransferase [Sphaerochaetaceae bacterium]|jgi:adenosylcobinamide kinase/adenosylcobinamide-phosphate guanylyltransferase|nr:bifunctional adenosylcobinamide kinase/adenosylcobinamide-phosphate guanylyltransferase [Sphaerochaetaceae bacterium]HHU88377.1 bifunctional adenosylcobinamide kinase/adenosylcobinamide-phosphate guanylyltransferase [Spirochaetales bacterium]